MKNNKGITLVELTLYIMLLLIVIGVLTTINNFVFKNMNILKENSRYAAAFDKFNSYFVGDVKNNKHVVTTTDSSNLIITFEDGTNYIYDSKSKDIYRKKIKIATNVSAFTISKKTIIINNIEKEILSVNIIIGTSSQTAFNQNIDYTLKYW